MGNHLLYSNKRTYSFIPRKKNCFFSGNFMQLSPWPAWKINKTINNCCNSNKNNYNENNSHSGLSNINVPDSSRNFYFNIVCRVKNVARTLRSIWNFSNWTQCGTRTNGHTWKTKHDPCCCCLFLLLFVCGVLLS